MYTSPLGLNKYSVTFFYLEPWITDLCELRRSNVRAHNFYKQSTKKKFCTHMQVFRHFKFTVDIAIGKLKTKIFTFYILLAHRSKFKLHTSKLLCTFQREQYSGPLIDSVALHRHDESLSSHLCYYVSIALGFFSSHATHNR